MPQNGHGNKPVHWSVILLRHAKMMGIEKGDSSTLSQYGRPMLALRREGWQGDCGRRALLPLALPLHPQPLAVRAHLDVAVEVGAEDGARLEAIQRLGRGPVLASERRRSAPGNPDLG